jgi:hypothetical protein
MLEYTTVGFLSVVMKVMVGAWLKPGAADG